MTIRNHYFQLLIRSDMKAKLHSDKGDFHVFIVTDQAMHDYSDGYLSTMKAIAEKWIPKNFPTFKKVYCSIGAWNPRYISSSKHLFLLIYKDEGQL